MPIFKPSHQSFLSSASLLLLRVVAGLAFIYHGYSKMITPFSWMGPNSDFHASLQFLAALAEFGGGILWILGFLTPLASLGLGITMAVATYLHAFIFKDPFVANSGGSYELALLYLSIAILLGVQGPGKLSLDQLIFGRNSPLK